MSPSGDAELGTREGARDGSDARVAAVIALLGILPEIALAVTGAELAARWFVRIAIGVILVAAVYRPVRDRWRRRAARLPRWWPRGEGSSRSRRLIARVWPSVRMGAAGVVAGGMVLALAQTAPAGGRLFQAYFGSCPMPRELVLSVPSYDVPAFGLLAREFTDDRAVNRCAETRLKVVASPPVTGLLTALRNGWRTPDGVRLIGPRPDLVVVESRDIADLLVEGGVVAEDVGQVGHAEIAVGIPETLRNQVERETGGVSLDSVLRFYAGPGRNFARPDPLITGIGLTATAGLNARRVFPNAEAAEDRMRELPEEMGDAFWKDQSDPVSLLCNLQRDYESRRNSLLRRSAFMLPRHIMEDYNNRTGQICPGGDQNRGRLWIPDIPSLAVLDYRAIRPAWPDRESAGRNAAVRELAGWLRSRVATPSPGAGPAPGGGALAATMAAIGRREQRLDLALVLDGSGSMQRHLPVTVRSVGEIVDALRPTDRISVDIARRPSRDGRPQIYNAYPSDLAGSQGDQIVGYLGQWTPRDWDLDAASTIAAMGNRPMDVMVIVTDTSPGKQADLRRITAEVVEQATGKPSDAPVYIVNVGDTACPPALRSGEGAVFCVDAAAFDVTTALDRLRELR
ncbi:hypothetical protein GT755_16470 [Herbidospora sp. NEAU-GS84]|uniref:VWA domain-containing protein n=1 Tax=Herbidospora solisilvae TaxID=2696284 RepID=A0A7C9JC73_9ACTN|nr:vWA domain-containing protein [Herbidospora solisilvae]NAS23284.1 hypothetical protein [Herbidospora solisilvae]